MPRGSSRRSHRESASQTRILPGIAAPTREDATQGEEIRKGPKDVPETTRRKSSSAAPRGGISGRRGRGRRGGESRAQGDAAMWAPGGGSQPSKPRLLPHALLRLPSCCSSSFSLFFFLPSESFLVLGIEVRRWSRGSINWRVGDTTRSPLKLFQACPVFLILFFPRAQA